MARLEVPGAELHYEVEGEGTPVVLVHGLALDTRMWDDQVPALADIATVVRYDVRGFGRSTRDASTPYGTSFRVRETASAGTVPRVARRMLAGAVIAASLGAVGAAAAGQPPIIRSVRVVHRQVALELTVGNVRPVEFMAAKHRALDAEGGLLPRNVRLQETIELPASASGVVRWLSPSALRPGTYFIQVKAVETGGGGVTDCPPKQRECNVRWSSLHRVLIKK